MVLCEGLWWSCLALTGYPALLDSDAKKVLGKKSERLLIDSLPYMLLLPYRTCFLIIIALFRFSIFFPSDLHAILLPLVRCAGGARELHKLNKLTKSLWTPEDLRGRYIPHAVIVILFLGVHFKPCKKLSNLSVRFHECFGSVFIESGSGSRISVNPDPGKILKLIL